jgi:hypothetical protein
MFFSTLERVKRIGTKHCGKSYSPEGFTRLIRSQIKDPNIKFYTRRSPYVPIGDFDLGAEYRPHEDEFNEPFIHVFLTYSTRQRKMKISSWNWDTLAFSFADVIVHEYVHQKHIRKRNFKYGLGYNGSKLDSGNYNDTMKNYLGCEDEILAYSFNVASEMAYYGTAIDKTRVVKLYRKVFRRDPNVVLKLKRHALKYIKQLEKLRSNA